MGHAFSDEPYSNAWSHNLDTLCSRCSGSLPWSVDFGGVFLTLRVGDGCMCMRVQSRSAPRRLAGEDCIGRVLHTLTKVYRASRIATGSKRVS